MKLLKPAWVTHDGKPIFSIDIHPDGSKFATGGQGDDSGRVVIWNVAPIVKEQAEEDDNVPKLLCQMDNHLACVNCVRWSNSGQYLASGGDDKLVMIWQLTRYAGSTIFGGGGKTNIEHWRCVSTLRGHSGDVLDLGWSPDDQYLASSSVDNTVRIWNMLNMPESIAVLKGHTGLVKGIAWDPIGKYVASQSDDKTVRVWKTSDWKQETVVTEPFEECGGTTHVLRLNWSPDGQYLVSAHAMNGGGPTAQIIERDGWKTDKDFVGHRKAITCVSFNSNMLRKSALHKGTNYCCCAIGSRDRSLSIWLTSLKRPLVVIHELFLNSVLDLSWSRSGYQLMACSWDGSVAYIEFDDKELGQIVSVEEKENLFQRMYGKKSFSTGVDKKASVVIEDPDWIQPQLVGPSVPSVIEEDGGMLSSDSRASRTSQIVAKGPTDKQIETRTVDGRRRITPVFIPPLMEEDDAQSSHASNHSSAALVQPTFSSSTESRSKIIVEKRDEVTKPGLSSTTSTSPSPPQVNARKEMSNILLSRRLERNEPERSVVSIRTSGSSAASVATTGISIFRSPDSDKVAIAPLSVQKSFSVPASCGRSFEIENQSYFVGHKMAVHKLSCVMHGKVAWDIFLSSPMIGCAASVYCVAVTCSDATLHCFAVGDGSRMIPGIKLQGPAVHLRVQDHFVSVVTAHGQMNVWDIIKRKSTLKTSILSLTDSDGSVTLTSCTIRDTGLPILSFSNSKTYTYSTDMDTWLLLADAMDPLRNGSDLQGISSSGSFGSGPSRSSVINNADSKIICSISYADLKMSALAELNSPAEYRTWLMTKVKYMAQQGMEDRLRSLCEDLLGPVHRSSQRGKNWQPTILTMKKNDLLHQVLQVMATNVKMQRLCTEFQQQLKMLTEF